MRFEIHDDDFAKSLNPIRSDGQCITLEAGDDPVVLRRPDGEPWATLHPGCPGEATDLVPAEYEAIVASDAGVEDDGTIVDDPDVEAAGRELAWELLLPCSPMQEHRGVRDVHVRRAQAVLRAFGVPPERCTLGGLTYTPRRSLLAAGVRGHELVAEIRANAERRRLAEAAVAAALAAREANARRPIGERGLGCLFLPLHYNGPRFAFDGVAPLFSTAEGAFVVFRQIPGWEATPGSLGPARFLPPETILECDPDCLESVGDPNATLLSWILAIREDLDVADRGPVAECRRGLRAREAKGRTLAHAHRRHFWDALPCEPWWWKRQYAIECLVRGLLLPVELACEILVDEVDAQGTETNAPVRVPAAARVVALDDVGSTVRHTFRKARDVCLRRPSPIHALTREQAETLCLSAARGGFMSPGALLEAEPPPPTAAIPPKRKRTAKGPGDAAAAGDVPIVIGHVAAVGESGT